MGSNLEKKSCKGGVLSNLGSVFNLVHKKTPNPITDPQLRGTVIFLEDGTKLKIICSTSVVTPSLSCSTDIITNSEPTNSRILNQYQIVFDKKQK